MLAYGVQSMTMLEKCPRNDYGAVELVLSSGYVPSERKLVSNRIDDEQHDHVGVVVYERKRKLDREGRILHDEVVIGGNESIPREKDTYTE